MYSRREGDSNPRYGFPYTSFPRMRIRPLCHLSTIFNIRTFSFYMSVRISSLLYSVRHSLTTSNLLTSFADRMKSEAVHFSSTAFQSDETCSQQLSSTLPSLHIHMSKNVYFTACVGLCFHFWSVHVRSQRPIRCSGETADQRKYKAFYIFSTLPSLHGQYLYHKTDLKGRFCLCKMS